MNDITPTGDSVQRRIGAMLGGLVILGVGLAATSAWDSIPVSVSVGALIGVVFSRFLDKALPIGDGPLRPGERAVMYAILVPFGAAMIAALVYSIIHHDLVGTFLISSLLTLTIHTMMQLRRLPDRMSQ